MRNEQDTQSPSSGPEVGNSKFQSQDGTCQPDAGERGPLSAKLSDAIVGIYAKYTGRGPTKARAIVDREVVVVILQGLLTKAEQSLIDDDQDASVIRSRRDLQSAMRESMVSEVENLTGRQVVAFLSDQQTGPDYGAEIFVLAKD